MSDNTDNSLDLVVGSLVYDDAKDRDSQTGMVVVDVPGDAADTLRVPGTGQTVAEYNEEYPSKSPVVTVAFQSDIDEKLDDWDTAGPSKLRNMLEDVSLRTYDYPAARLRRQTSALPEKIETYHDLICYQNARLIQLAAGVPYQAFLWKRYGQLKEGEFEMASITKEDKYQLQEDFGVCIYCKEQTDTTFDHVIPLSKGGADTISNQVPACLECNSSKGDQDVIEWCKEQDEPVPRIVWGKYLKQFEQQLEQEGRLHGELPPEERAKWDGVELQRNITDRIYKREREVA